MSVNPIYDNAGSKSRETAQHTDCEKRGATLAAVPCRARMNANKSHRSPSGRSDDEKPRSFPSECTRGIRKICHPLRKQRPRNAVHRGIYETVRCDVVRYQQEGSGGDKNPDHPWRVFRGKVASRRHGYEQADVYHRPEPIGRKKATCTVQQEAPRATSPP